MSTKLSIDVIAHEHNLSGYNPYYFYATKWNDKEWGADSGRYDSIKGLAKDIAECIVGTHSEYNLDSFLLEGVDNLNKRGIHGYSENPESLVTKRVLDRGEIRELSINLSIAIKERKRFLELLDD